MTEQDSLGAQLKAARLKAGFRTQKAFADHLSHQGMAYDDGAIGHWENNRRKPERITLLSILQALAATKGIETLQEINHLLKLAGYRDVTPDEQSHYFPNFKYVIPLENLPQRPFDQLIGRDEVVADVVSRLVDPTAKPVLVISGLGGIGKTAIAYAAVVRAMETGQFDKLAWESVKSETFTGTTVRVQRQQQVDFHSLLVSFARQLGFEPLTTLPPTQLEQQLRSILRQGSYLIVLDNLESFAAAQEIAHQLHALVSSPANPHPSKILITSRERLLHDPLVYDYFIQGLSEPATIDLLQAEAKSRGADLLAQTHQYDQRIYKTTGGMPLAIILIVTQFLLGISLDQELDRLEQTTNEEDLYRFIYFSIWEKLNIPAKKVLVGAATFGTSAQRDHLIRVSKTQSPDFEKAVADLIHFSLMEVFHYPSLNQQRYDIHPLTRWFVNGPLTDLWEQQRKQS